MTVAQFQKIDQINSTTPDTVERLGWIVCEIFNKKEDEVNHMKPLKFLRLVGRLEKMYSAKRRKWWQVVKLTTDAEQITFGQFVECQYWLRSEPIQALDMVAASIMKKRSEHKLDVEIVRKKHFKGVYEDVVQFVDSFNKLIKSYKGLFEIPDEIDEEEEKVKQHPFIENYAWIFSAKEVAIHEGITLDAAFELPVMQALNDLSYLKSKQQYDKAQQKK